MRVATFLLVTILVTSCSGRRSSKVPTGWCTTPGDVICSVDCSAIEICRPTSTPGVYDSAVLQTCPDNTTCWSEDMTCSATQSSCAPKHGFRCSSGGAFPDPYDCRKYYLCLETSHIEEVCSAGYAYNSLTKSCSVPVEPVPRMCAVSPVPVCRNPGQAGALCENTSLYYICYRENDQLFPVVYGCATGKVFDEVAFECVDPAKLSDGFRTPNIVNGCEQP